MRLHEIWRDRPNEAEVLQAALTMMSCLDMQSYPVNAKVYLQMLGVPIGDCSRVNSRCRLTETHLLELKQAISFAEWMVAAIG